MPTWLIAKQIVQEAAPDGSIVRFHPGDWFQTGRQRAQQLVASGHAMLSPHVTMEYKRKAFALDHCGVILSKEDAHIKDRLIARYPDIPIEVGRRELRWPRTLFLTASSSVRIELITVGFHRLNRGWQVAAPLWKYSVLARDIGTEEDKTATRKVIHDLRVPVYDVRAVFMRRCRDTQKLIDLWNKESGHPQHQFMRALYKTAPTICALPITWMQ